MSDAVTMTIPYRKFGFWALAFGALALAMVFFQIAAPSLGPEPSVGTQIGEIAGEIRRAAWRSFLGLPRPAPEPTPIDPVIVMAVIAPVLGIVAIVLSVISALMREHWRYGTYGAALGAAAVVFQFLWWVMLLVIGAMILVAIIENMGDIFG